MRNVFMRILAIILNLSIVASAIALTIKHGFGPITNFSDVLMVCLLFVVPIVNAFVLLRLDRSVSWLGLWLERKALEEKKKSRRFKVKRGHHESLHQLVRRAQQLGK